MNRASCEELFIDAQRKFELKKFDAAEEVYKKIVAESRSFAKAFYMLGLTCSFKDQKVKAIRFIEKSIKLGLRNAEVYDNLGTIYASQNNFTQPELNFKTAISVAPD